jgi:hypothetical protein
MLAHCEGEVELTVQSSSLTPKPVSQVTCSTSGQSAIRELASAQVSIRSLSRVTSLMAAVGACVGQGWRNRMTRT